MCVYVCMCVYVYVCMMRSSDVAEIIVLYPILVSKSMKPYQGISCSIVQEYTQPMHLLDGSRRTRSHRFWFDRFSRLVRGASGRQCRPSSSSSLEQRRISLSASHAASLSPFWVASVKCFVVILKRNDEGANAVE